MIITTASRKQEREHGISETCLFRTQVFTNLRNAGD